MPTRLVALANALNPMPERPTKLSVIEGCSLFNGLTTEEKESLVEGAFLAYAERGEMIWQAGTPSDFCAIVGLGFVKMTKTTSHGQEVALELMGAGQVLGLLAALEGRAFPLSATAVTNTWYLKIPRRMLLGAYGSSTALKDQVVRSMGPRLRRAHDMTTRMSSGRVEERVAAVLFIIADSYGETIDDVIRLTVPLTRQEIAEMAGTTVETAIRVFSRWQKAGIVATDHHIITIRKPDELAEVMKTG
jgi:CRP/FNR family transcriptional regulator, nitrogen oxide reductase regulator